MGFKLTREEYKGLKTFQEKAGGNIKKTLMEALDEFSPKQSRAKTASKIWSKKIY